MSYTEDTSKYFIYYVFKQATAFCLNMMIKAQKQNIQKECKQKMSMTTAKDKKEGRDEHVL